MSTYGTDPVLVTTRVSRTDRGTARIEVWAGSSAGIDTVLSGLSPIQHWDWDDSDAPLYRLTVRTPEPGDSGAGGSAAATTHEYGWDLNGSDLQRDLYEHPRTLWAASQPSGESDLKAIKAAIQDPQADTSPAITTPGDQGFALELLYKLLLRGTTNFLWPHYELRFNAVVSPSFSAGITDDGALRIFSAAQIISEYSNFPMPARIEARIQALQSANPNDAFGVPVSDTEGYTWGWMKKTSSENQTPDKRVRYSTSWDLELWNTSFLYRIG